MHRTLQHRYDELFADSWRAPVQSRRDLVLWACAQKNAYLEEKGVEGDDLLEDCANYNGLLRKYGPDYSTLKAKLGHVRGLFDE